MQRLSATTCGNNLLHIPGRVRINGTPAVVLGRAEAARTKVSSAIEEAIARFGITDPARSGG